ncbi:transposase [Escherichia coli]|nr:transposase [Escherichia coli]SRZ24644.1 transposase [Escherichia coli]SRZ60302.1 transposase [Escherichia coli]
MATDTPRIPEQGVATLPDEAWERARRRAEIISPLAQSETVGHEAADMAAQALGLSRRQVYVLIRGPERLVGICIDKGYKFPLNQCFKAYLFFIFNSLKCLGIDNKSNLYSPRKVICSQLIGDTCFIYLVTSGSILTR